MFRFVCLAALLVSALAVPENDSSRVVGGELVPSGKYPFIVSIRIARANAHSCGGSILNSRWILTAAHCVYGNNEVLSIVAGVTTLQEQGAVYQVEKAIYNPNFQPQNLANDIALIKVSRDITFGPGVQPIAIERGNIATGTPLTVIGWGRTSATSDVSNELRELTYPAIDLDTCAQMLQGSVVTVGDICTFDEFGKGSCNGDSGGPLTTVGGRTLAGLVSYGRPCAIGYPDVYTNVNFYLDWVQSIINFN